MRKKILARYAAIRCGITDAKQDIDFALHMGHGPFRWPPEFKTPQESELWSKAYERTLVRAVVKAFQRVARKADEARERFGL